MNEKNIFEKLKERFGDNILELKDNIPQPFIRVNRNLIEDICFFLRDEKDLLFDSLACLSGVDYKDYFTVVYHLFSTIKKHKVVLKADIERGKPEIKSVERVWKVANWFERETYDMFGILFLEHSDLRRILLPEDWKGYPLRKDYKYPEEYHGITAQR
jgi:NADH-quinone oxidoreductase subunit C